MLQAMRLILRHDLANIQMAVLGYETFLRDADRALAQVSDLLGKLVPLVERVAVLEAQQSQSGIDRKELRERMRIQENEMVLLKREVALLKTQMQPVRLTDAPG